MPFYGFNLPNAKDSQGIRDNWWRQCMMGWIKAFSEADFTEDLKLIDVPTLVLHVEDDQVVPFANSGALSVKLMKKGTLKSYPGLPHGMCTTHPEIINPDILAFLK